MIGGQFHNERSGLPSKGFEFLQHDTRNDNRSNTDEESGGGHPGGIAEHRPGKQTDDGHLSSAGDETGGHNRHLPVAVLLNGSGGHDTGHTAAGSHQHGDEALTGETETAEETIHDEGNTGHIAHILQNGQQEEQYQHLRHKAQHRSHTGHDAVLNQPVEPTALGYVEDAQDGVKQAGDYLTKEDIVGPVGAHSADGDAPAAHGNRINAEHDYSKDWQCQNPIGDNLVNLVGNGKTVLGRFFLYRLGNHAVNVGVPLVGDDALSVIVQLFLAVGNMFLQVLPQIGREIQFLQNFLVPFKNLNGIPAQVAVCHLALNGFLNVGQSVFYAASEHMR